MIIKTSVELNWGDNVQTHWFAVDGRVVAIFNNEGAKQLVDEDFSIIFGHVELHKELNALSDNIDPSLCL